MTRSKLMTLVTALISESGRDFTSNTAADQNEVCNRRLRMFSERTRCIYDDRIAFTLNPSAAIPTDGVYDLRGAAFTQDICWLDFVTIAGSPLNGPRNEPGIYSLREVLNVFPNYQTNPTGKPVCAVLRSPQSLRLIPVPDQAYTNCFASGAILHPEIATGSGGDATELSIPEEYCDTAAIFVAIGLVIWGSDDTSDYERMSFFSQVAADDMKRLTAKSNHFHQQTIIRGQFPKRRGLSIG